MKNAIICITVFSLGIFCGSIVTAKALQSEATQKATGSAPGTIPTLPPLTHPIRSSSDSQ
jgi:hypothetical protein